MHRFSFHTAGESHGRGLISLIEGVPAGLQVDVTRDIDPELARRQGGYGRGRRMQIESDHVEIISGIRLGETLGSPVAFAIWNRDWENWTTAMAHEAPPPDGNPKALRSMYLPRPGHADLVGVLKYDRRDTRDILERASARETAARVAAGALAKHFLAQFGVRIGSHITAIGGIEAELPETLPEQLNAAVDETPVRCIDPTATEQITAAIDQAKADGDTLGGVYEVVATGVPVGLGSHVSWDAKLDGRLCQAVASIQATKAVEIGDGVGQAHRPGTQVHDPIVRSPEKPRTGGMGRASNRAGGLEGGITTGEPLIVRGYMKPISTLRNRLPSVDLRDGSAADAATERSDVCAVPAAGVIGEAMVALVLADAFLEKFGGDAMSEIRRNFDAYLTYLDERGFRERSL